MRAINNKTVGLRFAILIILGLLLVIISCQFDSGFISPSDDRNLRPLGTYVGKATPGDSGSLQRLIQLAHPKVTLLWRGVGLRDKLVSDNQISIDAKPPFAFSLNLLQPPPAEVTEAPEIAFGIFSLYSDENQNGNFDRLIHPDLKLQNLLIDSLAAENEALRNQLNAVSEIKTSIPADEKFLLDIYGDVLLEKKNGVDTAWILTGLSDEQPVLDYLKYYQRILSNQNRWERFFANRKKDNEFYLKTLPNANYFREYQIRYNRQLFPKSGMEKEFNSILKKVVISTATLFNTSAKIQYGAFVTGKLNYPFDGFGAPGQDWMAGRAIQDLLVFFRTQATLDTMLEAASTGSFRFNHITRLHVGYNLFRCDDQYICDVRAPGDSISIYLGTTEAFFNAPPTQSENPFSTTVPNLNPTANNPNSTTISAKNFIPFQGRYALNGSDTISFTVYQNQLWCETPEFGLVRVKPTDSLGFASPYQDLQGIITHYMNDKIPDRLVLYFMGNRYVTLALGEPVRGDLIQRIKNDSEFLHGLTNAVNLNMTSGIYNYNSDTLKIEALDGDSLRATIPHFASIIFYAVSDTVFKSPWGEWFLTFQGANSKNYQQIVFNNGRQKIIVPNFSVVSSNLVKSNAAPNTVVLWTEIGQGTGHDNYVALDEKKRYRCAEFLTFLKKGDGSVSDLDQSVQDDSVSLRPNGDKITFRITGFAGKTVSLQTKNCADQTINLAKANKIGVSIWGGPNPKDQQVLYHGPQWLETGPFGRFWIFDSLSIETDPYYLTLQEENTGGVQIPNAFDGYWLGLTP